jgi:conjugal transfer/entry exclusion protein
VSASQNATGALQAAQAGNQLLERFPITVGHIRKMRSSFGIRRSRRDRRACR